MLCRDIQLQKEGTPLNDSSIIELLRKRDERAVSELKLRFGALCMGIACSILSQREDAEECVNSAWLDVWDSIPPDEPDDLKAYVCRIVKNNAIDRLKYNNAAKRSPQFAMSLDELGECIPDRNNTENEISAEHLGRSISSFLRKQKEKHRKVFVKRYWYGESVAQIAKEYGMNEKTVATYLFRTRKKLKDHLKKEGFDNE